MNSPSSGSSSTPSASFPAALARAARRTHRHHRPRRPRPPPPRRPAQPRPRLPRAARVRARPHPPPRIPQPRLAARRVLPDVHLHPPPSPTRFIRYEGLDHYLAARARGKGVLVLTGHLGAWELSSFYHSLAGYPMGMVIRRLDNPLVDALVNRIRCQHGNRVLHKDDFARGLLAAMRAGETVGILMDTNMTPPAGPLRPLLRHPRLHRLRPRPRRAQDRRRRPPRLPALGGVRAPVRPPLLPRARPRLHRRRRSRHRSTIPPASPPSSKTPSANTPPNGSGCTAAGRPAPPASRRSTEAEAASARRPPPGRCSTAVVAQIEQNQVLRTTQSPPRFPRVPQEQTQSPPAPGTMQSPLRTAPAQSPHASL